MMTSKEWAKKDSPVMIILSKKQSELDSICRKYGIETLYVFGSSRERSLFKKDSDIDLFVDQEVNGEIVKELSNLFGRKVDLICRGKKVNFFVYQTMQQQKQVIWEQS